MMLHTGAGARRDQQSGGVMVTQAAQERIAPGKRDGGQLPRGARDRAAEVILRIGMPARKTRTSTVQDGGDTRGGGTAAEQFLGDPFVDDAPVRLWEALANVQPVQPTVVDV